MKVIVYSFEDADGEPPTDWTTFSAREAYAHARAERFNLIENHYAFEEKQPNPSCQYATADKEAETDEPDQDPGS